MRAFDNGIFTISLDFELAWGCFDSGSHKKFLDHSAKRGESVFERSRYVVRNLLKLFERYDVPTTWATVGHLFLEGCSAEAGVKHADMPRPSHSWFTRDWYVEDPCGDIHSHPLWYGRDLVELVAAAQPKHDIGSHSFSHVIFADQGCTRDVAKAEIEKCVELAREMGLELHSFIFPRNQMAHVDVLVENGFRVTREGTPFWYMKLPSRTARRLAHVADDLLALPPPTGLPFRKDGILVLPASMFLQSMDGPRGLLPARARVRKAELGLDLAVRRKQMFHLLFHPINFYVETDRMLDVLESILKRATELRAAGALQIMTMRDVADYCDGDASSR